MSPSSLLAIAKRRPSSSEGAPRASKADQTKADFDRAKLMQARDLAEDKMDQNEELAELRAGVSLAKKNNANIN